MNYDNPPSYEEATRASTISPSFLYTDNLLYPEDPSTSDMNYTNASLSSNIITCKENHTTLEAIDIVDSNSLHIPTRILSHSEPLTIPTLEDSQRRHQLDNNYISSDHEYEGTNGLSMICPQCHQEILTRTKRRPKSRAIFTGMFGLMFG